MENESTWLNAIESDLELLRDPKMERIIDQAKAASEAMQIIPHSSKERNEIVSNFDEMWGEWYGEPVYARGKVRYEVEGENGKKEKREAILWDTRVVTNGFSTAVTHLNIEGDKSLSRLTFHMSIPTSAVPDSFKEVRFIPAVAELDEVTFESTVVSTERALPWLTAMHPRLVEEIDERLTGSMSVSDSIVALADIDIARYLNAKSELARNCTEVYLTSLIDIDREAEYGFLLDGQILNHNEVVKKQVSRAVEGLGVLGKVLDIKLYKNEAKQKTWELALVVEVYSADHAQASIQYTVPFASIVDMKSMREMFYGK